MPPTSQWRSRPVFISSTFRDMNAERDYLARYVFPDLEERLRERRHDLVPIDLRWGVETVSVDDQRAKELLVLKVCLAEIERSRPFFVALLGDRYGWVPPEERMRTATEEAGFEIDVNGKSVTALEIEYGVLSSPDQRRRSFFYFRDPLPYDEMDPETAARYSDAYLPDPGGREAHARLQALKARIERELPDRVRHYRATWDSTHRRVTNLEDLGRQVLEDLWRALDEETAAFVQQVPATWQEQERATLEEFVQQRGRGFVGREGLLGELMTLVTSPAGEDEPWGACVVAEPGAGKSALFAALVGRLVQDQDLIVLAHAAGISTRSSSVDMLLRRWMGELAARLGVPDPGAEIASREDLEDAFAELLSQAATASRVVLLLDGLNQFERTPAARHLTWLPHLWPRNVRLIATTLPGTEAQALGTRKGVRRLELSPLMAEESRRIARALCARYHRTLHAEVVAALLNKSLPERTASAGNPLWLLLAMEDLLLLDEDDFARLGEFAGTAEQKLHALLLTTVESFAPDVTSMYGALLRRTEEAYGRDWARRFAALLAVSRWGLRESDLRALLPKLTGELWENLRFSTLRRGFRAHLVQRGALGQWDFAHAQAREAVLQRSQADAEERRKLHAALADHLDALPADDPLRQSELMVHLVGADDRARAARTYGGELSPAECESATRALAAHIVAGSGREPNAELNWVCSLLDVQQHGEELVQSLCARYNSDLLMALANDCPISDRIALISNVERTLAEIRARHPEHVPVARSLAASHSNLGGLHRQAGDLEQARVSYEQALALAQVLVRRMPDSVEAARSLAGSYGEVADLAAQAGNLGRARDSYERALALIEKLCERMPDSAEDARNLEIVYGRLALLHQELGNLGRATDLSEQALTLAEGLVRLLPDNVHATRDLAVNYERVGSLRQQRGDLDGGRDFLERALAQRERLYRRMPDSIQAVRDVWMSHNKLGSLNQEAGDVEQARVSFEQALALAEELYRRMPGSAAAARDVANTYNRLGVLHQEAGELDRARAAFERSLALAEELHQRMPDSGEAARDLAVSHRAMGLLHVSLGDLDRARDSYERALALTEELVQRMPESAQAARDLWVTCNKLAGLHRQMGDLARARDLSRRALALAEQLQQRVPEKPQAAHDLLESHTGIGLLQLKEGDLEPAQESYERALALAEQLQRRMPESPQAVRDLADIHRGLGLLHLKAGRVARALDSYERALALAQELAQRMPESPQAAQDLVTSLLGIAQVLGNAGQARESQRYLIRCRAPLRTMKKAGVFLHPYLEQLLEQLERIPE